MVPAANAARPIRDFGWPIVYLGRGPRERPGAGGRSGCGLEVGAGDEDRVGADEEGVNVEALIGGGAAGEAGVGRREGAEVGGG